MLVHNHNYDIESLKFFTMSTVTPDDGLKHCTKKLKNVGETLKMKEFHNLM